jgi:hypothetical protein
MAWLSSFGLINHFMQPLRQVKPLYFYMDAAHYVQYFGETEIEFTFYLGPGTGAISGLLTTSDRRVSS